MAVDASDDLHTPIVPRARGAAIKDLLASAWFRQAIGRFTQVGSGIVIALFGLATGWVIIVDDPLGGEPQAQSRIEIAATPVPAAEDTHSLADFLEESHDTRDETVMSGGPQVLHVPRPAQDGGPDGTQSQLLEAVTPRFADGERLRAMAHPSLVERFDATSFVPALGPNGERPLDAYARPLEAGTVPPGQPRIALVVGGLGLSQTATLDVLSRLPAATTLAFAPYGNSLSRWASRARQDGHEYLIEVPMEAFDFPNNDPGPHTLQVALDGQANIERLHWALSRLPTPIGLMNYMGGRFTSEEAALRPVVDDALGRGLLVLDDGRSARSRIAAVAGDETTALRADLVIDARLDQAAIDNRLAQLEALAQDRGYAVGVASAFPLTIQSLEEWTASLATKGIALVPVSSLVRFPQSP